MIEYSTFSSGMTNTSIAVAELLQSLGHTVTLLSIKGTQPWWDDCQQLQKLFRVAHLDTMDLSGNRPDPVAKPYDLIFEIGVIAGTFGFLYWIRSLYYGS
jgi:hypothetical protein